MLSSKRDRIGDERAVTRVDTVEHADCCDRAAQRLASAHSIRSRVQLT